MGCSVLSLLPDAHVHCPLLWPAPCRHIMWWMWWDCSLAPLSLLTMQWHGSLQDMLLGWDVWPSFQWQQLVGESAQLIRQSSAFFLTEAFLVGWLLWAIPSFLPLVACSALRSYIRWTFVFQQGNSCGCRVSPLGQQKDWGSRGICACQGSADTWQCLLVLSQGVVKIPGIPIFSYLFRHSYSLEVPMMTLYAEKSAESFQCSRHVCSVGGSMIVSW